MIRTEVCKMIYVKVNDALYVATIGGMESDRTWDNRRTKSITLSGDFATIDAMFVDGMEWSIVCEDSVPVRKEDGTLVLDENGEITYEIQTTEFDNSDYNMRGDLTVHSDGTCTVKMGQKTEMEIITESYAILMGDMA